MLPCGYGYAVVKWLEKWYEEDDPSIGSCSGYSIYDPFVGTPVGSTSGLYIGTQVGWSSALLLTVVQIFLVRFNIIFPWKTQTLWRLHAMMTSIIIVYILIPS